MGEDEEPKGTKLNYARRALSDKDLEALPLKEVLYPYEEVDFSRNSLSQEGLKKVLDLCRRCEKLRVLKLYRNDIGDEGAKELAAFFAKCKTLEEVHLSHNRFTDVAVEAIVAAAEQDRPTDIMPLWLRLEQNDVSKPHAVLDDLKRKYSVRGPSVRNKCTTKASTANFKVHLPHFYFQKGSDQGPERTSRRQRWEEDDGDAWWDASGRNWREDPERLDKPQRRKRRRRELADEEYGWIEDDEARGWGGGHGRFSAGKGDEYAESRARAAWSSARQREAAGIHQLLRRGEVEQELEDRAVRKQGVKISGGLLGRALADAGASGASGAGGEEGPKKLPSAGKIVPPNMFARTMGALLKRRRADLVGVKQELNEEDEEERSEEPYARPRRGRVILAPASPRTRRLAAAEDGLRAEAARAALRSSDEEPGRSGSEPAAPRSRCTRRPAASAAARGPRKPFSSPPGRRGADAGRGLRRTGGSGTSPAPTRRGLAPRKGRRTPSQSPAGRARGSGSRATAGKRPSSRARGGRSRSRSRSRNRARVAPRDRHAGRGAFGAARQGPGGRRRSSPSPRAERRGDRRRGAKAAAPSPAPAAGRARGVRRAARSASASSPRARAARATTRQADRERERDEAMAVTTRPKAAAKRNVPKALAAAAADAATSVKAHAPAPLAPTKTSSVTKAAKAKQPAPALAALPASKAAKAKAATPAPKATAPAAADLQSEYSYYSEYEEEGEEEVGEPDLEEDVEEDDENPPKQ